MLPRHWPRWMLIVVALGLTTATIALGIALAPAGRALAPGITPQPTLAYVNYARPLSTECERCHLNRQMLASSAPNAQNDLEAYYIEPSSLETPHGRLGCITCHGGTGDAPDKEVAHRDLIADLSESHPETCLLCHRNLPDQLPEDHLRTPHGAITNAAWEGSACGVKCSDCHGQVGHGFDPVTGDIICGMSLCLDCHKDRGLTDTLTDCNTCHVGPHDVALAMTCKDCHTSATTWKEATLRVHPVELTGAHAKTDCFTCHRYPNFRGLDYVCSDCHKASHNVTNDNCALCHTPEGWAASASKLVAGAPASPHPLAGRGDCRSCHGLEGVTAVPADHKGRTNDTCQVCHTAAPAPAILHPLEGHTGCLNCHGEGQIAEFRVATHEGRTEDSCSSCHDPAGVVPLAVAHSTEGRADCVMCHGPQAFEPYPETHQGWGNQLCQLCHTTQSTPTEGTHTFPQDHNQTGGNCAFCHRDNDFSTYHCETCHALTGMTQVHQARGISEIESKCVLCHPRGTKP